MQDDELLATATEVAGMKVLPPCAILARVGMGGMGAVYRGRHLNLDIDVAVKVMKPELVHADPQFVARFRREGQSAAKICHQNVIRVYDVAEDHDLHYLIMEFVQGETARQRVDRKGQLAVGEAMQILYEAALGLGAAHKLGIVHRDVKPDNLMISSDGQVKVADLGLAKPTLGGRTTSMLSSPNQIMGTPCYMPPEQWDGAAVTAAADVWALGATLWFLLVGREAITGDTPARIMSSIVLQPFPDVRELRPDVPAEVAAVLAKATAKEAHARYASANELADAIADLELRRTSLCDDDAGATMARTMLSPPPAPNLDQIKSWLREDLRTRQGTPTRMPTPPPTSKPTEAPSGTIVRSVATGVAVMPSQATGASPQRRGWLLPSALLLCAAGGGTAWALSGKAPEQSTQVAAANEPPPANLPKPPSAPANADQPPTKPPEPAAQPKPQPTAPVAEQPANTPPPPQPFAEVDRLATAGELDAAIRAAEALTDAALAPGKQTRLADLHARKAAALQRDGRLAEALDQLAKARSWQDSPALQQQRRELTSAMAVAAGARLQRTRPEGPQPRASAITFAGRLRADYDAELRLAGEPVARGADGTFSVQRQPGADGSITVEVAVDGSTAKLEPWRVEFAADAKPTPPPPPTTTPATAAATPAPLEFVGSLDAQRTAGRVIAKAATLRISGRLCERDAELLADGKPVAALQWQDDGSFTCNVPLPNEGRNLIELRARKGDREGLSTPLEVVRLTTPPPLQPVQPVELATAATSLPQLLVLQADEWTDTVRATRAGKVVELKRDGAQWRGEVPLEAGKNQIDVVATNFAGLTTNLRYELDVRNARMGAVQIVGKGDARKVDLNQTIYVPSSGATLAATLDPGTWLLVDGKELPGRDTKLALTFAEGSSQTLKLQACNAVGKSGPFTVTVVVDSAPPTITPATPTFTATAGADFECSGTWTDTSGLRMLRIDGKPALVDKAGTWRIKLPAPAKDGSITIVATDSAGNQGTTTVPVKVQANGG